MDPRPCLSGTIPKEKEKERGKAKAREKAKAKAKTSPALDPTTDGTTKVGQIGGATVGTTTVGEMIDEAKEAANHSRLDPTNKRRHGVRITLRANVIKAQSAGISTLSKPKSIR